MKSWKKLTAVVLSTIILVQSVDLSGFSSLVVPAYGSEVPSGQEASEAAPETIGKEEEAPADREEQSLAADEEEWIPQGTALRFENGICTQSLDIIDSSYLTDDLIVEGNLNLRGRLQLNQHSLIVKGEVRLYSGDVIIDGTLEAEQGISFYGGSVNLARGTLISHTSLHLERNDTVIRMSHEEDRIRVQGNLYVAGAFTGGLEFAKGTLELSGDYLELPDSRGTFSGTGIQGGEGFRLVLNGAGSQMLDIQSEETMIHTIEMTGEEMRRLYLPKRNTVEEYNAEICEIYTGIYRLNQEIFDFEEEKNTRYGSYYYDTVYLESGDFSNKKAYINIYGDFFLNGNLKLESSLTVNGNFNVQGLEQQDGVVAATASEGILDMTCSRYAVLSIHGDFLMNSMQDQTGHLTTGNMALYGSLYQYGSGISNFVPEGDFYLDFRRYADGSNCKISFEDPEHNWLPKMYANQGVVEILNEIPVKGECFGSYHGKIRVTSETISMLDYVSGSLEVHMAGDIVLQQNVNLPAHAVVLDGSLNLNGHTFICKELTLPDSGNGCLVMEQESDILHIMGDFYTGSLHACEGLNRGTILFGGNVTQKDMGTPDNLVTGEGLKVVFNGAGTVQEVSFDSEESGLHTVEIRNGTGGHTRFLTAVSIVDLTDVNGTLIQPTEGVTGYTLTEDTVVNGNLWLIGGTLDLNGHSLRVTGDIYAEAGDISINKGVLLVEGDLRIQGCSGGEGEPAFCGSFARLQMNDAEDTVIVQGDFYEQREDRHTITSGSLKLAGDLYALSGLQSFGRNCNLILNGTQAQTLDGSSGAWNIGTLRLENPSQIRFAGDVIVNGSLYDSGCGKTGTVQITGLGVLASDYTGDVQISPTGNGSAVLRQNTRIQGNLYMNQSSSLDRYTLQADCVEINRSCSIQRGTLQCNILHMNAPISMTEEQGSILVRDFYVNLKQNAPDLRAGTILLQGSFVEEGSLYSFCPNGTHKTVLQLAEDYTEEPRLAFKRSGSRFQILQLDTELSSYAYDREARALAVEIIGNYGDTEPPVAPEECSVSKVSYRTATLNWSPAADDSGILEYRIYENGILLAATASCDYTVKDLLPGSTHIYQLQAVDMCGNTSEYRELIVETRKDVTPPKAAGSFSCGSQLTATTVPLSWRAASDDDVLLHYNLYRDDALLCEVTGTSYVDRTVEEGVTYTYSIEAEDWSGNVSARTSCTVTPLAPPDPVTGLKAVCDEGVLTVSWDGNNRNVSVYRLDIYMDGSFCDSKRIAAGEEKHYTLSSIYGFKAGTYVCTVYPQSAAGQTGREVSVSLDHPGDLQPPAVTVTGFHSSGIVNEDTRIQVKVRDNCVIRDVRVEYAPADSDNWISLYSVYDRRPWSGDMTREILFPVSGLKGDYNLRITAVDRNENTTTEVIPLAVNYKDVNIITVTKAEAKAGGIHLEWEAMRPDEIACYRVKGTAENGSVVERQVSNALCDLYGLYPDMNYSIQITPYKSDGTDLLPAEPVEVRTLPDVTPPGIILYTTGKYVSQTCIFSASVRDDIGIQRVEFSRSQDGENWEILDEKIYSEPEQEQEIRFEIDTTKLEDGICYLRVVAYDFNGNASDSAEGSREYQIDNTPPAAPAGITGQLSNSAIHLRWEADPSEDISYYNLYRKTAEEEWTSYAQINKNCSYTDSRIEPDQIYTYRITAVDEAWNESGYSMEYSVSTKEDTEPPSIPRSVVCTGKTGSSIRLEWCASSDNIGVKEYQIYRDDTLVQTTESTGCQDTGLQTGKYYTYTVRAVDWRGNVSGSSEALLASTAVTTVRDITPKNYESLGAESVQVTFGWNRYLPDGVYQLTGEYSRDGHSWVQIEAQRSISAAAVNRSSFEWSLKDLEEGEYQLRIRITDPEGNEVSAVQTYYIDKEAPEPVRQLQVKEERNTVRLYWDKSVSADLYGYRIYRRTEADGEWLPVRDVEAEVTTCTDTDVTEEYQYQYAIGAYDIYEHISGLTESEWITVGEDTIAPEVVSLLPQNQILSGRAALQVKAADNRSVAKVRGEYYDEPAGRWLLLDEVTARENQAELIWDTSALHGRYKVRIWAADKAGNENATAFEQYYDIDNVGISKVPNFRGTALTNSVVLAWDAVPEDDFGYFSVEQLTEQGYQEIGRSTTILGYQADGLEAETEYTFRVVGYDLCGNRGEESEPVTLVTAADTTAPVVTAIRTADGRMVCHDRLPLFLQASDNTGLASFRLEYSLDGEDWRLLAEMECGGSRVWSGSYDWDVSGLPEGSVHIRGIVKDSRGNANNEDQYVVEYGIDHSAPEQVSGVRWKEAEGIPVLEWNPVADNDIQAYRVIITDGNGGEIQQDCRSLFYEHRQAGVGQTYIYRVCAIDQAGNAGAMSVPVAGTRGADTTPPQIRSLTPATDRPVCGSVTLSVMVTDNTAVREVSFYYQEADAQDGSVQWIGTVESEDGNGTLTCSWDTAEYPDGIYRILVQATDTSGNKSDWLTAEYQLDNTPPERAVLLGTPGNYSCILDWSPRGLAAEELTYELYRRSGADETFQCLYQGTETTYTDSDVSPDFEYGYKVCAIDAAGNTSETYVTCIRPYDIDDTAPVAFIAANTVTVEGYEQLLDGTQSMDNQGIKSFHWSFGDGTEGTGARPRHIYGTPGSYTVTLTVTDKSGNSSTDTTVVKVLKKDLVGAMTVTVTDKNGTPVPGASVYLQAADDKNELFITDEYGQCRIVAEPGSYRAAFFKTDYVAKEENLDIRIFEERTRNVVMTKGDAVGGNLTVRKLNFQEMVEAGIDFSAPENQHIFIFITTLTFEERKRPVIAYINSEGKQVSVPDNINGDDEEEEEDRKERERSKREDRYYILDDDRQNAKDEEEAPTIVKISISQQISWLKDMYEARLTIFNRAESSSLMLTDNRASIRLPQGISLARTAAPQSLEQNMGVIRGGQCEQAVWYLKGDVPGIYRINAAFHGTLMPFQSPVSAEFESNEFHVNAGEGLVLYILPEAKAEYNEDYYVYFVLRNEGDTEFYNINTTFGNASLRRSFRVSPETNGALPVMSDGDYISIPCLRPKEEIRGVYVAVCREPADNPDKKWIRYLKLMKTEVEILQGKNLGIAIKTKEVESHFDIPDVFYCEIDPSKLAGDPVDTWSGGYVEERDILSMGGTDAFAITMQYNSRLTEECGAFGYGWVYNYESRLVDQKDGTLRYYTNPNGYYTFVMDHIEEQEPWTVDAEGNYDLNPDMLAPEQTYSCMSRPGWRLSRAADGTYVLEDDTQTIYTFSAEGMITGKTDRDGRSITISQSDGQVRITDQLSGRSFTCDRNADGLIETITDSAGRSAHFYYDTAQRLSIYENALGERIYYTYDDKNHILTGAYQDGVKYVVNTYDEDGRVLTQDDGMAETPLMSFDYSQNEENGHTITTVTNRLGYQRRLEYDAYGNICQETNEAGQTLIRTYDENGNEITLQDANGNSKECVYDEQNNMIRVQDDSGTVTTLEYDENNQIIAAENGQQEGIHIRYNDRNQVTETIDQNGAVTSYAYNDAGQVLARTDSAGTTAYTYAGRDMIRTTDPSGSVTEIQYDAAGQVTEIRDGYGVLQSCRYDGLGRVVEKTNAAGGTITYTYDIHGNIHTVTDPSGGVTTYEYNDNGWLERVREPDGGSLSYTLNAEGWITAVTDSLGRTRSYEYDSTGNIVTETDPEGNQTRYTYDGGGRVLTTTGPQGSQTATAYLPNGKTEKETDSSGREIAYTYDQNGRITGITSNTGETQNREYDPAGNLTAVTDAMGGRTEYTYDDRGNVLSVKDPMGAVTRYEYDGNNNVIRQTDALGNQTAYTYDGRNRLTRVTRADGSTITLEYDAGNNIITATDPAGNTTGYEYDSQNRCTRIVDGYGTTIEATTYNYAGKPITVADALGNITYTSYDTEGQATAMTQTSGEEEQAASYTYDQLGRLTRTIDSMGNPVGITYDALGNITGVTDAKGGTTTYEYDTSGNLTAETSPVHAVSRYTYNAQNLLEEAENAAGETTRYTYDALGRITEMTDGLGTIRYTYDRNSNVLTVEENGATIVRTYDALNRVTSYTDYAGRTIRYAYDEVGNLISLTYPGGAIIRYEYNPDGSLEAAIDGSGNRTEYTYNKNSQLSTIKRPDGSVEACLYDKAGRLTGQQDIAENGEIIQNLSYGYDGYGNITQTGGTILPDPGQTGQTLENRTMEYDEANRLIRYNGKTVRYDKKGNMTYGPLDGRMTTFRYDCRNRLIQAGGTTYTYDAENVRITSTTDGITTEYLTDSRAELSQVLEEYQNGEVTATYVYGNGKLIYDRTGEGERYYHYDNLGSTRAITNEEGEILSTYAYGVYGEILGGDTTLTGYLYNGAYGVHTDNNGLYYMRARYYNPDISRFINQDVLRGTPSASQSLNRYAYCQGNPVNQIDPFGLCPINIKMVMAVIHLSLALLGCIPGYGAAFDIINASLFFAEGDTMSGLLCLASAAVDVGNCLSILGEILDMCRLAKAGAMIRTAGIAYTTGTMAYLTGESMANTITLYIDNDYQITDEVAESAGLTVMSGLGTVMGYRALDGSIRQMQSLEAMGTYCFAAGTLVLTEDGFRNIEDIEPGDKVYSTDEETGESGYKEVLQVFVKETEVVTHVFYETNDSDGEDAEIREIETTLNHLFWCEGEWKAAGTLKAGDLLTLADGSQVEVTEITYEDRHTTVYNMEVADYHTYYVGEDGVWVHNTGACLSGNSLGDDLDRTEEFYTDIFDKQAEINPDYEAYLNELTGTRRGIPDNAYEVADYIRNTGRVPVGHKGGGYYYNLPSTPAGQVLPQAPTYKEYDINPHIKGVNRGIERIVIGTDGKVWYTDNHYTSFQEVD